MKEKIYNKVLKKYITIDNGEECCPKCKGKGCVRKYKKTTYYEFNPLLACDKCLGNGKIDWVEKITGVPQSKNAITTNFTHEQVLNEVTFEFARQVDNDILRTVIKKAEQNQNE